MIPQIIIDENLNFLLLEDNINLGSEIEVVLLDVRYITDEKIIGLFCIPSRNLIGIGQISNTPEIPDSTYYLIKMVGESVRLRSVIYHLKDENGALITVARAATIVERLGNQCDVSEHDTDKWLFQQLELDDE